MKDYYRILSIDKNASENEIKKAYRKKAKELHPDNKTANRSDSQMKELNEAYNVLKDNFAKTQYDLKYPSFSFENEEAIFYDHVAAGAHTKGFYDDWKEDIQYRRIMIYLWIILGVILAMIFSLLFTFSSIEEVKSPEAPNAIPDSPEGGGIKPDTLPKEIYRPYSPEDNVKEI